MMDQLKNYYKEMGVDEKVFDYAQEVEKGLKDRFETLDAIAQLNQIKVLNAMQKHQIAEMHLGGTTGYGYNDSGREAVEALYADVFIFMQFPYGNIGFCINLGSDYMRLTPLKVKY